MTNTKTKHIILVDDDPIINMISKKIISLSYDFTIDSFTNAQLAIEYFSTSIQPSNEILPIVIFLDINMPIMDGWEFLYEFEQLPTLLLSHCQVFILTSSIDQEDIEKSKTYKIVKGFISKPLSEDKIKVLEG